MWPGLDRIWRLFFFLSNRRKLAVGMGVATWLPIEASDIYAAAHAHGYDASPRELHVFETLIDQLDGVFLRHDAYARGQGPPVMFDDEDELSDSRTAPAPAVTALIPDGDDLPAEFRLPAPSADAEPPPEPTGPATLDDGARALLELLGPDE